MLWCVRVVRAEGETRASPRFPLLALCPLALTTMLALRTINVTKTVITHSRALSTTTLLR